MPGFGIASIFYICAALLAPFVEVTHVVRGTSTPARRRIALSQFVLGSLMIGALVGFYVGLAFLMRRGWLAGAGSGGFGPLPNWTYAVLTLVGVLAAGYVWGAVTRRRLGPEARASVAQAHSEGVARIVLDLREERTAVEIMGPSRRLVAADTWTLSGATNGDEDVVGRALLFLFPPDPSNTEPLGEGVAPLELVA